MIHTQHLGIHVACTDNTAKLKKANNFRVDTMNLQDLLDKVCNGMSDNKTSQKLGITRVSFSRYRNGHKVPSDEVLDKMAEISGLDPVEVYMAAYAEKITNPLVAKAFRENRNFAA